MKLPRFARQPITVDRVTVQYELSRYQCGLCTEWFDDMHVLVDGLNMDWHLCPLCAHALGRALESHVRSMES